MQTRKRMFFGPLTALIISTWACNADPVAAPDPSAAARQVVVDTSWVTGSALSAVNAQGSFVLPLPILDVQQEIAAERAIELASAWISTIASQLQPGLESVRGAPVDARSLRPCGVPTFVRSGFASVESDILRPIRRAIGNWRIVQLCGDDASPMVALAVSSLNTDVEIESGFLRFAPTRGNEFRSVGIPVAHPELPISPERAVQMVYRATSQRVASVPELVTVHAFHLPQTAYWRLGLAEDVQLPLTSGGSVRTREVLVGRRYVGEPARVFVAESYGDGESVADSLRYPLPRRRRDDPLVYRTIHLVRVAGAPSRPAELSLRTHPR